MADSHYSKRPKKPQQATETVVIENVLRGIGSLLKWLFGRKGGVANGGRAAQLRELGSSWENVEMHLMQPATMVLAVSEADKIVDSALRISGVAGATMGERLKAAENKFSPDAYQRLWHAHKLRNTLAHEVGASANPSEAKEAVKTFRDALYSLGVLS